MRDRNKPNPQDISEHTLRLATNIVIALLVALIALGVVYGWHHSAV